MLNSAEAKISKLFASRGDRTYFQALPRRRRVEVAWNRWNLNKAAVSGIVCTSREVDPGSGKVENPAEMESLETEQDRYVRDSSTPGKFRKVMCDQRFEYEQRRRSGRSEAVVIEEDLYLEGVGSVTVALFQDCLTWHRTESDDELAESSCWGGRDTGSALGQLLISETYGAEMVEMRSPTSISSCGLLSRPLPAMYRFAVHSFDRSQTKECNWIPKVHVFCHEDADTCQAWVARLEGLLDCDSHRPRNLLVLVNPFGGRGRGAEDWRSVAPLFDRARVRTRVIVTERSRHAYDLIAKSSEEDLNNLDGVVVVGGDGLFNEVLNGLLMKRHIARPAPKPRKVTELLTKTSKKEGGNLVFSTAPREGEMTESAVSKDGEAALPTLAGLTEDDSLRKTISHLRIGIIPSGSTDTIAISTTGSRDPVTAALHILLGDSMPLDVVKITGWKRSPQSGEEPPQVRYAASFAGYGFYGDVMKESETTRWLGPARYDIAGVKVFLKHRKYEAEVSFLDVPTAPARSVVMDGALPHMKAICRSNCVVCDQSIDLNHLAHDDEGEAETENVLPTRPKWKTARGAFHSVGAAVMSCRNEKAPDGISAHAHLADGLLHLILIRSCSRPSYLLQLLTLTKKGADPLNFDFVEHYKTPVFTFISRGSESVWNVDGELFSAHQLTAQCFRGLVNVFARGPEH